MHQSSPSVDLLKHAIVYYSCWRFYTNMAHPDNERRKEKSCKIHWMILSKCPDLSVLAPASGLGNWFTLWSPLGWHKVQSKVVYFLPSTSVGLTETFLLGYISLPRNERRIRMWILHFSIFLSSCHYSASAM